MRFLFPGFLFALFAVVIPIVIHLFNFRKFKKVYFSNVRFLKEIEQQTSSARQLRDLLLLAARILFITFLVLAFAKPYIPSGDKSAAFQQQLVSVYLDNSYSMETLNPEGSLLDEAKRRAKEIASAYGVNDKFQLLTNDFEGRHQRLLNYEDFQKAVDEVKISGASRDLSQIITRQQDVFGENPNSKKTLYLISDFQKNMLVNKALKADTGLAVRLVQLQANPLPNISVDSVWFISPVHKPGDPERLVVQLRNNSEKKAENVPIKLNVNGQQKAIGSVSVEARASSRDTLSFSGLRAGWQQGEIAITDYPIVFDDKFYFSFHVEARMQVLSINQQGPNEFLSAVYGADPFFNLTNLSAGSINYSALPGYRLLVLSDVANISSGLAQQLKSYVQNGGNLMIFPADAEDLAGLQVLTQTLGTDVAASIANQETKVSAVNLRHPLFRGVFENIPKNVDLPIAKKYVQYTSGSRLPKQSILELPGRRTFLSQFNLGKGIVYLSAVSLSDENGNFVRHSLFVPIMYQAAFLSLRDNRLFYTVAKDQYLESSRISLAPNQTLKLRKEGFETIPDLRQNETGTRLFIADQIREPGNYKLMKADSLLAFYAFNDNRRESDLSYAGEDDLKSQFAGTKPDIFKPGKESVKNAIKAVNYGVQLWKLCLILALIFLACEILILKFYKPGKPNLKV